MESNRVYRIREVAEYLDVSSGKVYELVRSGRLASIRIDGVLRVRGADVLAMLEAHLRAAVA